MSELKVVSEIRINGKWMSEDEIDPMILQRILNERIDYAMRNQGFIRKDKTA